jgi:hypothetical protein
MVGLTVELIADGGVRLTTSEGRSGMAAMSAALDWVAAANEDHAPVRLTGAVAAPSALPVAAQVRAAAQHLDEIPTAPAPWPHGRSSLQTAAADGHVAALADLLARGADPDTGRWGSTPYRLAMQRGQVEALRVLRDAGARRPRGLDAPNLLPGAVVLRAYPPAYVTWVSAALLALAVVALVARQWAVAPLFAGLALVVWLVTERLLVTSKVAVDGPLVARRRVTKWQGPVDVRRLDGLGYAPPANVRTPALWVLAQRDHGDRPDTFTKRAFTAEQLAALGRDSAARVVALFAQRGFLTPGIERYFATHVERRPDLVVGPHAEQRIPWPEPSAHDADRQRAE